MKPNIFDIGPKELNLDAFLAWLMLYASDEHIKFYYKDDVKMSTCAKEFISQLLQFVYPDARPKFDKVESGRQWVRIDVWSTIDAKYCIIIEDKTHTGHHSDQLRTYKRITEKWCKQTKGYLPPVCIYLKTGDECLSSLRNVEAAGFHVFNRKKLLDILARYQGIQNQISKTSTNAYVEWKNL